MKKLFLLCFVPAVLGLFFSCASGPKLEQMEEPVVAWNQDFEYYIMTPADENTVSLGSISLKKDANAVRVLDIRTGEVLQELSNEEVQAMAKEAQAAQKDEGGGLGSISGRIFRFPDRDIQVSLPVQKTALAGGNCNGPYDDIVVSELSSGKELGTLTRKGFVFDCAVTDDSILLFYQRHIDVQHRVNLLMRGNYENGALVKHSLETGNEEFVAEVNFTMQQKAESLARFYLSGAWGVSFTFEDYNFSGIIVDGDMAYLASEGISAVDLTRGKEAWQAKIDILTGENAMAVLNTSGSSSPVYPALLCLQRYCPSRITRAEGPPRLVDVCFGSR